MEEDICVGCSAMVISDKIFIIAQRGLGSELSGYLEKNIPGRETSSTTTLNQVICLTFWRKTKEA